MKGLARGCHSVTELKQFHLELDRLAGIVLISEKNFRVKPSKAGPEMLWGPAWQVLPSSTDWVL